MQIYIYSRKSVYTGKGESVENQVEMCRQYISHKIPHASKAQIYVYEDEGFSAKDTNRPRFQQMLRDMKTHKPDYVVCYRLDRISRNVSDFSSLIETFQREHISFVCIREEFDTSKPMGKAMMYMASVFAQLERETIAERVRDNMRMLARTGRWLGGTPPTGFTSESIEETSPTGKQKTSCTLKDNPEELIIINEIFRTFWKLHSISGVKKHLIQQGMHSRTGKPFSLPGIKEILQNPVYCMADREAREYFMAQHCEVCFDETECSDQNGLLAYNKRDYRQKGAKRQAMDQWIVAVGRHKGHIPGKQWVAIQNILKDNIPTGNKPALLHNDYAFLSGIIWCGQCQSRMFAKKRQSGRYDYICDQKLRCGTLGCTCQNLNGPQAERMLWQALLPYLNKPRNLSRCLESYRQHLQKVIKISCGTVRQPETASLAMALSKWMEAPQSLPVPEKRALLRRLVEKIVWDGQTLHIFVAG